MISQDYYPFGMMMVGRKYLADNSYRYGFNGKENDNEVNINNFYDLGLRWYDVRLGRMFSVDPQANDYSWQSSYAYHRNNPIAVIDFLGGGDEEPVEPVRKSTTIKNGDNLWNIAKKVLGAKATNAQVQQKVNELIDINKLNSKGDIKAGQEIFLESKYIFSLRYKEYLEQKITYDRKKFESFPKPIRDPRNKYEGRPGAYIDNEGNFFQKVNSYDKLLHASVIGADVAIITGGMRNKLIDDIHIFNDPDNVDFYQKLANQFKASGRSYVTAELTVRFGPINKLNASTHSSTYIMRNAQVKYWISYNANGTIRIEIHAYDYFNVTPQGDKDSRYNEIGEIIDPIHRATGANPNMQTRAIWEKNVQ